MPTDLERPQCRGVLPCVEKRLAVVRPDDVTRDVRNHVGQYLARCEVTKADYVSAAANRVDRIGEDVCVWAHIQRVNVTVLVSLGLSIDIEDDLLGVILQCPSTIDPVFLPVLIPPVVTMATLCVRHRQIALLDTALDLLEQLLLEVAGVTQPVVEIHVLGL